MAMLQHAGCHSRISSVSRNSNVATTHQLNLHDL
jgi:hypothetical protein